MGCNCGAIRLGEKYPHAKGKLLKLLNLAAVLIASDVGLRAEAAEFGTSIYPKGFRDIYAGIVPTVPGLYVANDAYRFDDDASAVVFKQPRPARRRSAVDPVTALTLVAKWYHEFGAERTFEGGTIVASASFKF